MLEVAAHMELLLQQAQLKGERPSDGSFMPLSLALACLHRQLPSGLAPPVGLLSFHQIDRLPLDVLEQKLFRLLYGGTTEYVASQLGSAALDRAFAFVRSLLVYVKTARAMLALCDEHLANQRSTEETTQQLMHCVIDTLATPEDAVEKEDMEVVDLDEQQQQPAYHEVNDALPHGGHLGHSDDECKVQSQRKLKDKRRTRGRRGSRSHAVAVDPSGIMKRALARDVGDGSAVVEILDKYPEDARIQAHGIRALKSVIRQFPRESNQSQPQSKMSTSDSEEDEEDIETPDIKHREITPEEQQRRDVIRLVIGTMKRYPDLLALQRDALFGLLEYTGQGEGHVGVITELGGIVCIMEAMARLPDDEEAQIAALSILGHPSIANASVVRVNPESRRLVMSAMRRFPLSERLQGLGCLALANLSLRHDESMKEIVARGGVELVVAAMNRFCDVGLIQAAGSWLLSAISGKNEEMLLACLDAGGLPVCEKARVRFASDPRVQQHAVAAIQNMENGHAAALSSGGGSTSPECCLQ